MEKYQEDVNQVFDTYMEMYLTEHPNERTLATARNFLHKHNDKYRQEINNIAILSFRNNDYDKAVHDRIIKLIDEDTFRLHKKITDMSSDLKELDDSYGDRLLG